MTETVTVNGWRHVQRIIAVVVLTLLTVLLAIETGVVRSPMTRLDEGLGSLVVVLKELVTEQREQTTVLRRLCRATAYGDVAKSDCDRIEYRGAR